MHVKYPIQHPFALSTEEILSSSDVDRHQGLSLSKASHRNNQYGLNRFELKPPKSFWLVLLKQFQSPIVYLLAFAALVSFYFHSYIEAIAIAIVLFINAMIGFFLEMQARRSMDALKKMDIITCRVIRDGKLHEINAEKIAPGDLVDVEPGDIIPADGRLIESNLLQCDESSLTGESLPTLKNIETLPEKTALGDQVNMVFKGSSVMNGHGKVVITGIGKDTELGKITSLVERAVSTVTPLDKKLTALSKKLIWIMLFMTLIFAATGIIQGKNWLLILETSIALAVAAFPEGLPIVATIALSYGMLLMAKRGAIVKNLSAVETLGSTNVILTDKTGTLTENVIYVNTFGFPDETVQVKIENKILTFDGDNIIQSKQNFEWLKIVAALNNNASVSQGKKTEKTLGDPVEIALLHLVNSSGLTYQEIQHKYKRIGEVPFDAESKMMATLHQSENGSFVAVKGAAEQLVEKCTSVQRGDKQALMTPADKKKFLTASDVMSQNGLRVLAFAYSEAKDIDREDYLKDLVYIGLIGFLDPPRLDIKKAITTCRDAGIKVVMITGDHPKTALNIAEKVGLVDDTDQTVINGLDLPDTDTLTKEWKTKILGTAIFARTTPKQKLDIADIYQKAGNIVAMTGDGVNDAPALKKADVGIAMGLRGTQVAKESANIVLKNDSFTSIAEAVGHGREIFNNIKKFVIYLVSCNLSEIFIVTTLGFYAPASTVLPLQILFLNIVTDVFPALALGLGKGDKTVMKRPPRSPKEDIVTHKDWIKIGWYALIITASVMMAVIYTKLFITTDQKVLNNIAFVTLAFAQLFHVFNMSSPKSKIFRNEVTRNHFVWYALLLCTAMVVLVFMVPYLRMPMGLVILSSDMWVIAISASLLPLLLIQLYKIYSNYNINSKPKSKIMLKTTFIIIVLLHGLIHLLGFLKAFDYVDITAITKEISKPLGIIWLTATILFLVTSLLFMLRNDIWVYVGLASVIISQSLIFMYWQETRYGSIANILILLVIITGAFHIHFKNKYKKEVQAGIEQTAVLPDSMLTNEDIKHLPVPVQKYIKYTGSIGKPKVHNFRIEFSGKIRSYEKKEWMALTSEQYNFMPVPTRMFFLDAIKMQMPVSGFHSFKNGKAFMDIRLLSMFKVQYMEGNEMDESETVTFFNDICCMAPAALIDERIQWLETEGNKVKATFTDSGHKVSAWLHFNEKGELVNFISEDRYAAKDDGGFSKLSWSTPLRDYKETNGYKVASYAEAIYTYPDGDFTYATFTLKHIGVNLKK